MPSTGRHRLSHTRRTATHKDHIPSICSCVCEVCISHTRDCLHHIISRLTSLFIVFLALPRPPCFLLASSVLPPCFLLAHHRRTLEAHLGTPPRPPAPAGVRTKTMMLPAPWPRLPRRPPPPTPRRYVYVYVVFGMFAHVCYMCILVWQTCSRRLCT